MDVKSHFGPIDIDLFDQLLRGRIASGMRLLDAGCGDGRNLVFFLREHFEVYGVDRCASAVSAARRLAEDISMSAELSRERFRQEPIEKMSFANDTFDAVIACEVLHEAASDIQFGRIIAELWRVLKPGGLLFVKTASAAGRDPRMCPLGAGVYAHPDRTRLFLAEEEALQRLAEKLHGLPDGPVKTVSVSGEGAAVVWCLKKPHILFFDPIDQQQTDRIIRDTAQDREEDTFEN